MIIGFAFALILILLTVGKDGRWLPLYGVICSVTAAVSGEGILAGCAAVFLLCVNYVAWLGVRRFTVSETYTHRFSNGVLPIIAIVFLQLALALSGASLGLVPTLGSGLVLAGLCAVGCGATLAQFCGLLMAVDGLVVMASVLASWGVFFAAMVFGGVMAVFGATLLSRLAWRRVDDV